MRIHIDASRSAGNAHTGTENVSSLMIRALLALPEAKDHSFVLYGRGEAPEGFVDGMANAEWKTLSFVRPWLPRFSRVLNREAKREDALYVPSHIVPFRFSGRVVTMVHGMEWDEVPSAYSQRERWTHAIATTRAVRASNVVLTPSEATKARLLDWTKRTGAGKPVVTVVPHGPVPLAKAPEGFSSSLTERLQNKNYFVFVGRHDARKNLPMLVNAFAKAFADDDVMLVLAGGEGSGSKALMHAVSESGLGENRILLPGHVSEVEKAWLLRYAIALTYPSRAEGFGLPLLEAFQAGCPVVASDIPVFREVVGDAAVLHALNVDALADALKRVADAGFDREALVRKGAERLKAFSWTKSAQEVLRALTDR